MARLIFPDGRVEREREAVAGLVAGLGARLRHKPLPDDPGTTALLAEPAPNKESQAELLAVIDRHVADWLPVEGHAARDLAVFHEDLPNLDELRAKFSCIHRHPDDEVRYILAGTGYFGFVLDDGQQLLLEVDAGDYLNVPRGAVHWFTLGDDIRLKAVRYFSEQPAWIAEFVSDEIDPRLDPAHLPS
jgi:1,2-dihydroxy-3-keto-5-methylthiopentene dioxygenase